MGYVLSYTLQYYDKLLVLQYIFGDKKGIFAVQYTI